MRFWSSGFHTDIVVVPHTRIVDGASDTFRGSPSDLQDGLMTQRAGLLEIIMSVETEPLAACEMGDSLVLLRHEIGPVFLL